MSNAKIISIIDAADRALRSDVDKSIDRAVRSSVAPLAPIIDSLREKIQAIEIRLTYLEHSAEARLQQLEERDRASLNH